MSFNSEGRNGYSPGAGHNSSVLKVHCPYCGARAHQLCISKPTTANPLGRALRPFECHSDRFGVWCSTPLEELDG